VLDRKGGILNLHLMKRILFVFGTRPEAIKLCPVAAYIREHAATEFETRICVTAQHRELLDQVLEVFRIAPAYDLNVMSPAQSLFESTTRILAGLEGVLRDRFDLVIVQGDTTTTLCAALAAFYARVPVAHVEAGLRTGNFDHPFPEEMNRVLATRLAALHFAATDWAAANLRREGVPDEAIHITGNPVIDAVRMTSEGLESGRLPRPVWPWRNEAKRLILVTAHRRESFGEPFERICRALSRLSQREDVQIAYPVHPNPAVRATTDRMLRNEANVVLLEPLSYVPFIDLMRRSELLLTDSGGVQEEGPSLGKPVLVMRETTERPEAVEAGVARLTGTDEERIVQQVTALLDDRREYEKMARTVNPYGDGRAGERILAAIRKWFSMPVPG
jgi:UDP-N-acetylglucosamine 2-epimerase (non-hydrolysing)